MGRSIDGHAPGLSGTALQAYLASGIGTDHECTTLEEAREKLERSIASNRIIREGEVIDESFLHMLSPGTGYKWDERNLVLGKVATEDIPQDEIIHKHMIK